MSIRTNPMKAVSVLLKRLKSATSKFMEREKNESFDGKLEKLTRELNKIEDVFMKVKNNQDALLDTLHEIDALLRKLDRTRLDQDMDGICSRIRDCTRKLLPMDAFDELSGEIVHSSSSHDPSSTQPKVGYGSYMSQFVYPSTIFQTYLKILDKIFPKGAVIKKSQAIHLWVGLGPIYNQLSVSDKTPEEVSEYVMDRLLRDEGIVAYGNGKCPIVNKFKLNPKFRDMISPSNSHLIYADQVVAGSTNPHYDFILLKQQKVTIRHEVKSFYRGGIVFNVGARYLNFGSKWLDKKNSRLEVLQLGRWQDSPSHHIEVASQDFLKDLSNQKHLRYLSLRGISRIFVLPPSIAQIRSLEILDLKACHNLETLPDDISSMKSLTHLILSQCYLLDGMPKGIDELTWLQVLKGFVLGSSGRISDLANLKRLRRLSIRIRPEAVINDGEFEILGELQKLKHLKISWGVSDTRFSHIQIILPPSLKKLHLECFPEQKIPKWLKPSKLPWGSELPSTSSSEPQQLKELKLTGGNLESMNHDEDMNKWSMEIVHLKYLRHLEVDITTLRKLFPLLSYAEITKISNHSYFEWWLN